MGSVDEGKASIRFAGLAARLGESAAALIAAVDWIDDDRWMLIPAPGVWSIGKDAEHVAEAATYHQWIVRRTIGQNVSSRRPAIERNLLTTDLSSIETVELLRRRTEDGARLLLDLTDDELALPTRPPRAKAERLAETIVRVLIGHYDTHRAEIEAKLRAIGEMS
jgi:uncharacterized damage-inducible protein DinB